jgi:hypothetical protein
MQEGSLRPDNRTDRRSDRVEWSERDLLASHSVEAPLVAGGVTCHGGFDADGRYRPPRTLGRVPAIAAWQRQHTADFGTEILDVPLNTWPGAFPNVEQAKSLLRNGVRDPLVVQLTRIGTVEGFGAMIRHATLGPNPQRHFDDSIAGTAIAHLEHGLFEAHARDEAGWGDVGGHRQMWFAARDIAFEHPVTADQTELMLQRMGIGGGPGPAREVERMLPDLDAAVELTIQRLVGILLIEISAFHTFAWAEALLADDDLVAGEGEAARLVSYIREDERPHVDYLRTALTEMRDRTFIGETGRRYAGADVVGKIWDRGLADSLGVRREQNIQFALGEIERALDGNADRSAILDEFRACGDDRGDRSGAVEARPASERPRRRHPAPQRGSETG